MSTQEQATEIRDSTMQRVRQTLVILLATTLLLAIFQSEGLVSWSYDLPPNAFTETVVSVVQSWNELMRSIGATDVGESVGDFILSLRDLTF
ncbi:hypothetical protein [uncultured Cohaesibacter sp.]|uniref:hypothetical protein n=1 Tax=uncultured Cohaesibacter sp. TaxID=1002546 RepID=UPI0029C75E7D|nr:hypothetical protein [uncultured Cohaesibacter sp.]